MAGYENVIVGGGLSGGMVAQEYREAAGQGSVLIVAEALHERAAEDVPQLVATLAEELARLWSCTPSRAILARHTPRFSF